MRFRAFLLTAFISLTLFGQHTRDDSLRGTLNAKRTWWDVQHYNLKVKVDITGKSISGNNLIRYKALNADTVMQIDLQKPLTIDSVFHHFKKCGFSKAGTNAWLVRLKEKSNVEEDSVLVFYSGIPRAARFAPWDGGLIWGQDEKKRPWVTVSCQGLGASAWWPNKDHQSDEPDKGIVISVTIPDTLVNISNGKLKQVSKKNDGTATWVYEIKNPINNYDVTFNIGKYVCEDDEYAGLNGKLKMQYCVLDYHSEKIESYLKREATDMLKCFEHWFGPYPFYEDGYRLVETGYLGMEHQSAVAYGNKFKYGYLGRDRSSSGIGLLWDFIIVHESGHEWFGNNITSKDIADMWIHEGFTTYSEALFIECRFNRDSADKYVQGLRYNINNNKPVIGNYGVNKEGSVDMYDKGANMIHIIRQVIDNDSLFRAILLGLNKDFYHQTVNTRQVEEYLIKKSGKDLRRIFEQYLRAGDIPELEYSIVKGELRYKWVKCVPGFNMPLKISAGKEKIWIYPETATKTLSLPANAKKILIDKNFYVSVKSL